MTIADLAALTEHVKIAAICEMADIPYGRISVRISRYRRGRPYAELTPEESRSLSTALRSVCRSVEQVVGKG